VTAEKFAIDTNTGSAKITDGILSGVMSLDSGPKELVESY
jgi:hypothetical protein